MISGFTDDFKTSRNVLSKQAILRNLLRQCLVMKSKSPPNKVMWVQTFGPASHHIQEAVAEANEILKFSTPWIGEKKSDCVVNLGNLKSLAR